jgi:hypothetical protein
MILETKFGDVEIKEATVVDYPRIAHLLRHNEHRVPTWSEIRDLSVVAICNGDVIGFIWACTGASTSAFLDFLVVDSNYRSDKTEDEKRSTIGLALGVDIIRRLKERGVTRLVCNIMDNMYGKCLAQFYKRIGFEIVNSLGVGRANLDTVFTNMLERQ